MKTKTPRSKAARHSQALGGARRKDFLIKIRGSALNKKELRAFAGALRTLYSTKYFAAAVSEAQRISDGRLKNNTIWHQIVREMEQMET